MLDILSEMSQRVLLPLFASTQAKLMGAAESLLGSVLGSIPEDVLESVLPRHCARQDVRVRELSALCDEQAEKINLQTALIVAQGNSNLRLKEELQAERSRGRFYRTDWNRMQRCVGALEGEVGRLRGVEKLLDECKRRLVLTRAASDRQRRLVQGMEATLAASASQRPSPSSSNSTQTDEPPTGSFAQRRKLTLREFVLVGERTVMDGENVCPYPGRSHITPNYGGGSVSTTIAAALSASRSSRSCTTSKDNGRTSPSAGSKSNDAASSAGTKTTKNKRSRDKNLAKKAKRTGYFDPKRVPVGYADVKARADARELCSNAA